MRRSSLKPDFLKDLKASVERVARASESILKDVEVVLFGGAASSDLTAASDIDILVVSPHVMKGAMERAELKEMIEREAGLQPINQVEIHLATPEEAEMNPIYREALKNKLSTND